MTTQKSVGLNFPPIGQIREASFFPPDVQAWVNRNNAKALRKARLRALRWGRLDPVVTPHLRHALNERIRHGNTWLRGNLRLRRWQRKLAVVIRQNILDRAAQVPLFPLLLNNLDLGEV